MKREVIFGGFLVAVLLLSMFFISTGASSAPLEQKNGWFFNTSTRDTNPRKLVGSDTGYNLTAGQRLSVSWNSAPYWDNPDPMRFYLLNSYQVSGWQWVYEGYGVQHEATNLGYTIKLDSWKATVACLINSTDTYYVIFVCLGDYALLSTSGISIYVYSYAAYVSSPPSVSIAPASVTMDLGQSQLFSSIVSGGAIPITYQWYLDGAAVGGATSYWWTFTPASAGSFSVYLRVMDSAGFIVDSAPTTIHVNLPLNASISPSSAVMYVGQSQPFTSTVSYGTPPYSYQWYLNRLSVAGANSSSWVFTSQTQGSNIQIYVKVKDSVGVQATSNTATVTVKSGLWVIISPSSMVMDIGQSQLITSSVYGGTPPYVYHWYMDGLVRDHHSDSWLVSTYGMIGDGPNPLTSPGSHTVCLTVTDSVGASATSNNASITVNPIPSVTVSPSSVTLAVGQSQTFTSSVFGGSPPYSYQWCLNGSIVSGATGPTWNYTPNSSGSCSVYLNVTDNVGVTAESNNVSVTAGIMWKLTVSSAHDSPSPSNGDHFYNLGAPVTCSITSPVNEGGVTYICTGWKGTGSVPFSGTGTSTGSFTITRDSSITWNWGIQNATYAKQGIMVGNYSTSRLIDSYFTAEIFVFNWSAPRVFGYQFKLHFDNTVLEAVAAEMPDGHWFTPTTNPDSIFIIDSGTIDQAAGTVSFAAVLLPPELGMTGSGILATVTFKVLQSQSCTLRVEDVKLADPWASPIPSSDYAIINGNFIFKSIHRSTDINEDGIVDILDLAIMARAAWSYPGHPNWDERCDLNDDDVVNILDLVMVATDLGKTD